MNPNIETECLDHDLDHELPKEDTGLDSVTELQSQRETDRSGQEAVKQAVTGRMGQSQDVVGRPSLLVGLDPRAAGGSLGSFDLTPVHQFTH